uniref:SHSP domain-containing protein n=1 Tax=Plectus sambesii TaxID=2011161 RepID=A0A914V0A7_9BILA
MPHREKEINVSRSNYSVIDSEFDNMRDRFENEMKRVEDEMGRLRREFEGYTPKMNHGTSAFPGQMPQQQLNSSQQQHHSSSYSTNTQRSTGSAQHSPGSMSGRLNGNGSIHNGGEIANIGRPTYDPYLDSLKSPLIKDDSDGKALRLRFNVSQYKPEEVTVKTVDNRLLVHAKHEEKTPQRTVYREYNQEFMLPRGTNPETITSTLSTDGVLTVEAPLPAIEAPPQR